VALFDSDVKRGISTKIGPEGITAIANEEFHSLQGFIVIIQGLQCDVEHRVSVAKSVRKNIDSVFDQEGDHVCCALPSAKFPCDKQVWRERGAKCKEISCNRNVASFDSNVKRSVSTRISFEGITATADQEFHDLPSFIITVKGLQYDVEHRVSVASMSKNIHSIFDHKGDHACCAAPLASAKFPCDKHVRRERGAKGKEISCNRHVASCDSDLKRGVSLRIGFEGITAMADQKFHGLPNFIVIVKGLQHEVEYRITIAIV
jgi:hypothetical protein